MFVSVFFSLFLSFLLFFLSTKQVQAFIPTIAIIFSGFLGSFLAKLVLVISPFFVFLFSIFKNNKRKKSVLLVFLTILFFSIVYSIYVYIKKDHLAVGEIENYKLSKINEKIISKEIVFRNGYFPWAKDPIKAILLDIEFQNILFNLHEIKHLSLAEVNSAEWKILDVRTNYEYSLYHLKESDSIPFGELIHNGFNAENTYKAIVLVCNDSIRSYVAANFLKSKGYEVYILKGGLSAYQDLLIVYKEMSFLWQNLELLNVDELNTDFETLYFGPLRQGKLSFLVQTESAMDDFIQTLSTNQTYIINCESFHYCYDANLFYERIKVISPKINILGYFGFKIR